MCSVPWKQCQRQRQRERQRQRGRLTAGGAEQVWHSQVEGEQVGEGAALGPGGRDLAVQVVLRQVEGCEGGEDAAGAPPGRQGGLDQVVRQVEVHEGLEPGGAAPGGGEGARNAVACRREGVGDQRDNLDADGKLGCRRTGGAGVALAALHCTAHLPG